MKVLLWTFCVQPYLRADVREGKKRTVRVQ